MPFLPTHRRLALWGQRLHSYLPPFSPAGLVGGHAMMRYAVSGQSTCSSSSSIDQRTPLSLSQLQAHIYSPDWQPSTAPVEVIWNANDAKAFHHVTPASAEDVAVCTEYLVRQSVAAAASRSQLHSVVNGKDRLGQSSGTPGSAARTATPPTQTLQDNCNDLEQTVCALREVVQTHCHLLAGSESLQTGVPLSYLLRQLSEAELYLAWCCPSLAEEGSCHEPSQQKRSRGANTADHHSFSGTKDDGNKDTGRGIERDAQRRALRSDFESEVRCLQEQLSSLSAAPASATATTAPPLISIITPTCNSLASAVKAAAVTWAATRDAVVDVGCGPETAVLWRPAAETALSAVWMTVLLRRSLQGTREAEARLQQEEKKGPSTATMPAVATDEPLLSSKGAANAVGGATSASLFHILVTGGDTTAHFVAPWVAGVQKAQHALSAQLDSSRGAGAGDSSSGGSSRSAAAPCQKGTQGSYRLQPLLLCYGCPDAQVSHLRASLLGITHTTNEPSGRAKDIGASGDGIDWTPNVVELRTEVPTIGLVLPAVVDPVADDPSVVAAAVVAGSDACAGDAPDSVPRAAAAAAGCQKPTKRHLTAASSFVLLHRVSSTAPQNGRGIEVVAKDVFSRAILEPPFLRRFSHTTDLASTASDASAFGAISVAMSALSSPSSVPVTVPGWCSLSFMDDLHAAALLRYLVQHHWKEPHYMGHSLAAPSRRGPLPSQAHALLLREALRDATTGGCSSGSRAAPGKKEERREGDNRLVWRHVCGGFALPLTATAGRESPYLLPGLLVCDLAAAMTAQQQRDLACFFSSPTGAEEQEAKVCRRGELDSCVLQAVQRVRRCVTALRQRYDTPERGHGGVVSGNLLFLCRYPAELAATVQAALLEGGK